jgi:exopolyphosphatase/guanosine-5'-triphosphate,3'-diphosphate pyrophosphatase
VKPSLTRRAVIDIGTNSVKLLVAELSAEPEGACIHPLLEKSEQTRLGQDFYETHQLQPKAVEHTAQSVAAFVQEAESWQASSVQLIATSVVRDAVNPHELTEAITRLSGLPVQVISGDQEAEWAFQGVTSDPRLYNQSLLILDVGGGSTELVLGERGHYSFRQSFPMGSVRLLEALRPGDPPSLTDLEGCITWLTDYFNLEIGPAIESWISASHKPQVQLVGTGGTTTILARMELNMSGFDRARIEGLRLSHRQVRDWMVHLWSASLAERQKIIGLPPSRADIIIMGVAIYEAVMVHFSLEDIFVSTRGLRFGALLQAG